MLLAALGSVFGCGDATGPLVTTWQATLTPSLAFAVGGRAAALTQGGRTQATITLDNGDPGLTYDWRLEWGTCSAPGALIGGVASYPPLEPGPGGTASAEAALAELFDTGDTFIVRVLLDGEGVAVTTVACAAFQQTNS